MNYPILITGIAASGKTTVCKELKRLGYNAVDIERIEGMFTKVVRSTGEPYTGPDKNSIAVVKRTDWICDKTKLTTFLNDQEGIIFCGGVAANIEEIIPLFKKVILLTAGRETIGERLQTRTGTGFGKDPEVQEMILGQIDSVNQDIVSNGAVTVDTDRPLNEVTEEILGKTNLH
ncbi:AAA family ATPase [Candidatus Uhrbacteria bacterium]|jgi:broad-specificity NMP kinase|nr:AAA family ATPase [Candidatus Uhrbacteria bacterium]